MDKMEVMLPQADKEEAVEILTTLSSMTPIEQREMLAFLRGVMLGKHLNAQMGA